MEPAIEAHPAAAREAPILGGLAGWALAITAALAACLLASPVHARGRAQAPDGAADLLAELERAEPERRRELLDRLEELGPQAAREAMRGLGGSGLAGRRVRSLVARRFGDATCVEAAIESVLDPDPEVSRNLIAFLSRRDLRRDRIAGRTAALGRAALAAADGGVRTEALRALESLGLFGNREVVPELERLLADLPAPERVDAARALGNLPVARERVLARVQDAFRGPASPGSGLQSVPDDVLAVLLGVYGTRLAEVPAGGESPMDRVPLVLGPRHPSPSVAAAAGGALDRLLGRLAFLGETERADRILTALGEEGADRRALLVRRALLAFELGLDPGIPAAAGRELSREAGPAGGAPIGTGARADARRWRWRGAVLEALGELGAGRWQGADPPLARAARISDAILADRSDLRGSPAAHAAALEQRALIEVLTAVRWLGAGRPVGDPEALGCLRTAHQLLLGAHVARMRDPDRTGQPSWEAVLSHRFAPRGTLFASGALDAWPRERALEVEHALYRAMASVAPFEMPGFEPVQAPEPRLADPLRDPARLELLQRIHGEHLRLALEEEARLRRIERDSPQHRLLLRAVQELDRQRREGESADWPGLIALRTPCEVGLRVAAVLREEGRIDEARELVERMLVDLERLGERIGTGVNDESLVARLEMSLGSSWTDAGEPGTAEELLLRALERLEAWEQYSIEAGRGWLEVLRTRALRSDALVGLAVNANVRQGDPEAALGYFERAFALRQDDFMRVLLACYRARAGRADEARELLRDLPISPVNYYNLGCTWALLGEADLALDHLLLDLRANHPSAGSLQRKQEWASGDPDLASLRGDPRFERMLAIPFEELAEGR